MSELDEAIIAFRENPTTLNERRLKRIQEETVHSIYRRHADEYIRRTK